MPSNERPPVVAILNSNDDVVEMLRSLVEQAGFVTVHGHIDDVRRGRLDLLNFIRQHDPKVIVYDLVPPYERSWNYLQSLRHTDYMEGRQFVLTSVNEPRAREAVGSSEMVYEIVGKPVDLDQIVVAIKEASKRRWSPRAAGQPSH
jgi:DNA-binding NarL/FixJ family response regulator